MGKVEFIALLTPAVSSFLLVILSWMQSNVRLARVEHTPDAAVQKQAAHMKEVRDSLNNIHNHLMTFYTVTGKLEGRIDESSRK